MKLHLQDLGTLIGVVTDPLTTVPSKLVIQPTRSAVTIQDAIYDWSIGHQFMAPALGRRLTIEERSQLRQTYLALTIVLKDGTAADLDLQNDTVVPFTIDERFKYATSEVVEALYPRARSKTTSSRPFQSNVRKLA